MSSVAVTVERPPRLRPLLVVRLGDGQEVHLTPEQAAAVVTVVLAQGDVHALWLHGRPR